MLQALSISKKYKRNPYYSLQNVSYTFQETGLYVITGPSGSGKSTLLGILSGVDEDYEGTVLYDGVKVNWKNAASYRNNISSIVFQELNLIPSLNVKDNLRIAFELSGKEFSEEAVSDLLSQVNLPDKNETLDFFLSKNTNQLSGGQKQRLAIARSLISKGKIMFLDEPTASLDEKNSKELAEILFSLSKNMLIVIATHQPYFFQKESTINLHLTDGVLEENQEEKDVPKREEQDFGKENSVSFQSSLKLSSSFFKRSKIRMIINILICLISLVPFSFLYSSKVMTDPNRGKRDEVLLNTQASQGIDLCLFSLPSTEAEKKKTSLQQKNAHQIVVPSINRWKEELFYSHHDTSEIAVKDWLSDDKLSMALLDIWEDKSVMNSLFTRDERLKDNPKCHVPRKFEEIAISSIFADALSLYEGDGARGWAIEPFSDVNQMIGRNIGDFTIVDIYHTKDEKDVRKLFDLTLGEVSDVDNYSTSYCMFFYCAPGYAEYYQEERKKLNEDDGDYMPQSSSEENTSDESSSETETAPTEYYAFPRTESVSATVKYIHSFSDSYFISLYDCRMAGLTSFMLLQGADFLFYLCYIFLAIDILSLIQMFSSNIKKESYTYSILNALGCSKKGIFSSIFLEAFIISLSVLVLSIVFTSISFQIYNSMIKLALLQFTYDLMLILVGVLLVITLLVTAIGGLKASKTNPAVLLKASQNN